MGAAARPLVPLVAPVARPPARVAAAVRPPVLRVAPPVRPRIAIGPRAPRARIVAIAEIVATAAIDPIAATVPRARR